jgi:hypothetical protein
MPGDGLPCDLFTARSASEGYCKADRVPFLGGETIDTLARGVLTAAYYASAVRSSVRFPDVRWTAINHWSRSTTAARFI